MIPTEEQQQQFEALIALLQKWNRVYNLTAITDPEEIYQRHILDSLSILPYLYGDRIFDLGTGAGFPGLPLAICAPGKSFVLLDGNGKKIRFVRQAIAELGLKNVTAVHARAEQYTDNQGFSAITARAVGSVELLMQQSKQLLRGDGCWLLMKGVVPEDELQGFASQVKVHQLQVAGLDEQRHLLEIPAQAARNV